MSDCWGHRRLSRSRSRRFFRRREQTSYRSQLFFCPFLRGLGRLGTQHELCRPPSKPFRPLLGSFSSPPAPRPSRSIKAKLVIREIKKKKKFFSRRSRNYTPKTAPQTGSGSARCGEAELPFTESPRGGMRASCYVLVLVRRSWKTGLRPGGWRRGLALEAARARRPRWSWCSRARAMEPTSSGPYRGRRWRLRAARRRSRGARRRHHHGRQRDRERERGRGAGAGGAEALPAPIFSCPSARSAGGGAAARPGGARPAASDVGLRDDGRDGGVGGAMLVVLADPHRLDATAFANGIAEGAPGLVVVARERRAGRKRTRACSRAGARSPMRRSRS